MGTYFTSDGFYEPVWVLRSSDTNQYGFYEQVIKPYNERGIELKAIQEEVKEICNFFGAKVLFVRGNSPTDKILIEKCEPKILLFNLEQFNCPRLEGTHHQPENEVRYFTQ